MASSGHAADAFTPTATPFISSTIESIKTTASNASAYLHPNPSDLLMALPRLAHKMGSFWYTNLQEHMEDMVGLAFRGRMVPEATASGDATLAAAAGAISEAQEFVNPAASGGASSRFVASLGFQNVRGFGGMFAYMTSKWALWCILMAIILNRTQIYASARRRLVMHWHLRLAIRIIPVVLFINHIIRISQAIRCQTSPDYSLIKYGNASKKHEIDFATSGGLFYHISSTILFWQDDTQSCIGSGLISPDRLGAYPPNASSWNGSLSLLWPLFRTFCISQFLETLSCALEGRQVQAETGMTLFEHSLAFAEAEAMISAQLGIGPFTASKDGQSGVSDSTTYQASALAASLAQKRQTIMDHVNTPPEVLLIGLISGLSHLTSHILAIFRLQAKYRLISTGFFGVCFMSAFIWSFYSFSPGVDGDIGILRFPTVCIVGFIPHLLILVGIAICGSIYLIALTIVAFSPPEGTAPPRSIRERFAMAHENLQANMQVSNIRIYIHEDFYTTLLKLGFMALTAASEAVYLNEGRPVNVNRWTWLEEERLTEYQRNRDEQLGVPPELREEFSNVVAEGIGLSASSDEAKSNGHRSGYAKERRMEKLSRSASMGMLRARGDGVGASERSGRWLLAYGFFKGIFWLLCSWCAINLLKTLRSAGFRSSPKWLRKLARRDKLNARIPKDTRPSGDAARLDFWLLSEDGVLTLPENDNVDVEIEMRKRLQSTSEGWSKEDEADLDSRTYQWFLHNGWWGEKDESGDYNPGIVEDDISSMISTADSAAITDSEWESDTSKSGRQTPTQAEPYSHLAKPTTSQDPSLLDPAKLARLLDPQTLEDRTEARLLAHHLNSDHIVTRAQYNREKTLARSKVLTTGRYLPNQSTPSTAGPSKLSPEDEEELLEQLIIAKRNVAQAAQRSKGSSSSSSAAPAGTSSWADGAAGLGAGGPQCVVCQSSPRTVLVWPCRCLSLCEDCRVSLAMNNFGNCVCCRRDVVGFSRIWVP